MEFKGQYERNLKRLLEDAQYSENNRKLWDAIFTRWERKLKRMNGLSELDESNYKTLLRGISKFKNVDKWFKGVDWADITEEQFRQVFNDLEDGKILKSNGKPLEDKQSYYFKIFLSLPFEMCNKKDIAKKVLESEFYQAKTKEEVNFISEEEFRKLVSQAIQPRHRLLLWTLYDVGENVGSILKLTKNDFTRKVNLDTKTIEYIVHLNKGILKRSRTPRSLTLNYNETIELLEPLLNELQPNEKIFNFGQKQAEKIIRRCGEISKVVCKPTGKHVSLKDLRSSMACNLLSLGWTTDELRQRLGHSCNSKVLNRYVSYLALNSHVPKQKLELNKVQQLQSQVEELQAREKLLIERLQRLMDEVTQIKQQIILT